ncbi:hypothetical protein ACJJTC_005101 [Scirpophaga incertulas]
MRISEWITVGTASLRREFEAQTRTLWASLMSSLQASCKEDALAVDAFVVNARMMLDNKTVPKTAKDLAEVSARQQALQNKMPEIETIVQNLKQKAHMLRTWGGDSTAEETMQEWHKIREMMLSHQQVFEHQADVVKSSLSGDWENLNTSVEAWTSRWVQSKSRLEDAHGASYAEMADRCRSIFEAYTQWEKYTTERDELLKECEKFDLILPIAEVWKEAEQLMKEYLAVWNILKEYIDDFESIIQQDWIIFQKKLHVLDDLVVKWSSKLEPFTAVTLFIQQELEKYTDLTMLLKYLRGTDFTEQHWREVYSLLDMDYRRPDLVKVQDFINVATNIKKQIKALQKICATASSEAAIRNALNELELWFAGARLHVIYYTDKTQRPVPVVKDFKDILNKVSIVGYTVLSIVILLTFVTNINPSKSS